MDPADLILISNREIIAIDQAGIPARPLDIQHLRNKPQQAWIINYPNVAYDKTGRASSALDSAGNRERSCLRIKFVNL